jgi:hypothetical protein
MGVEMPAQPDAQISPSADSPPAQQHMEDTEEEVDVVGSDGDEYSDDSDDEELSKRLPRQSRCVLPFRPLQYA